MILCCWVPPARGRTDGRERKGGGTDLPSALRLCSQQGGPGGCDDTPGLDHVACPIFVGHMSLSRLCCLLLGPIPGARAFGSWAVGRDARRTPCMTPVVCGMCSLVFWVADRDWQSASKAIGMPRARHVLMSAVVCCSTRPQAPAPNPSITGLQGGDNLMEDIWTGSLEQQDVIVLETAKASDPQSPTVRQYGS